MLHSVRFEMICSRVFQSGRILAPRSSISASAAFHRRAQFRHQCPALFSAWRLYQVRRESPEPSHGLGRGGSPIKGRPSLRPTLITAGSRTVMTSMSPAFSSMIFCATLPEPPVLLSAARRRLDTQPPHDRGEALPPPRPTSARRQAYSQARWRGHLSKARARHFASACFRSGISMTGTAPIIGGARRTSCTSDDPWP